MSSGQWLVPLTIITLAVCLPLGSSSNEAEPEAWTQDARDVEALLQSGASSSEIKSISPSPEVTLVQDPGFGGNKDPADPLGQDPLFHSVLDVKDSPTTRENEGLREADEESLMQSNVGCGLACRSRGYTSLLQMPTGQEGLQSQIEKAKISEAKEEGIKGDSLLSAADMGEHQHHNKHAEYNFDDVELVQVLPSPVIPGSLSVGSREQDMKEAGSSGGHKFTKEAREEDEAAEYEYERIQPPSLDAGAFRPFYESSKRKSRAKKHKAKDVFREYSKKY